MKKHILYTVTVNHQNISYFYTREKNDRNGNPCYTIYIIDPDGVIYEKRARGYYGSISDYVRDFIETGATV